MQTHPHIYSICVPMCMTDFFGWPQHLDNSSARTDSDYIIIIITTWSGYGCLVNRNQFPRCFDLWCEKAAAVFATVFTQHFAVIQLLYIFFNIVPKREITVYNMIYSYFIWLIQIILNTQLFYYIKYFLFCICFIFLATWKAIMQMQPAIQLHLYYFLFIYIKLLIFAINKLVLAKNHAYFTSLILWSRPTLDFELFW